MSAEDKAKLDRLVVAGAPTAAVPVTTATAPGVVDDVKSLRREVSALKGLNTAAEVPADHGNLVGLADDDHTQYHTDARGDVRYAALVHHHFAPVVVHLTPADAIIPAIAGATLTKTAGPNFTYQTLDFADAALSTAYWQFAVPISYDGGSIAVNWAFLVNAVGKNVRLNVNTRPVVSDDGFDAAMAATGAGGTRYAGGTSCATGDVYQFNVNWTTALPTANGFVVFAFARDGGNAADTLDGLPLKLLGIRLTFNGTV